MSNNFSFQNKDGSFEDSAECCISSPSNTSSKGEKSIETAAQGEQNANSDKSFEQVKYHKHTKMAFKSITKFKFIFR